MAIDANTLCKFSQGLVGDGASEVELRAASSRAYYAAYHSLLWLGDLLPPSSSFDPRSMHIGHRELRRRISEWKTDTVHPGLAALGVVKNHVSLALETSRKFREACDYQLDEQISFNEARAQVERARRILRHATQFREIVYPENDSESGVGS